MPGPVLRVDDEDPAGTDDDVVDVRQPAVRPSDVMERGPASRQNRENIRGRLLSLRASLEELSAALQAFSLLARPPRNLVRRLPRHIAALLA